MEYLYDVAKRYKIVDKVQLNTNVEELRYIEADEEWEITLSHLLPGMGDLTTKERSKRSAVSVKQETVRARVVVSCVGILVEPNAWPSSIPGQDVFQGDIIHPARWRSDIEFRHKNVIVIGSGCSAAQIVPTLLQTEVKTITQVMRTPPWVEPRRGEPFGKGTYARYAPKVFRLFPFTGYALRSIIYWFSEFLWSTVFQSNSRLRSKIENASLIHMRSKVPEKYQEIMKPDYHYGCKRSVFDNDWLESMNSSKFVLTVNPLKKLEARSATLGHLNREDSTSVQSLDDIRVPADIVVLANGFEATKFLHPLKVYGRKGHSIHDLWDERGGAQAYMGTAIDGFPNFFMTVGPNTFVGHSSVILGIESTVGYILKMISPVLNGDVSMVEPKPEAVLRWSADMQGAMGSTVFAACNSWYKDEKGRNTTMYPSVKTMFNLKFSSLSVQWSRLTYLSPT